MFVIFTILFGVCLFNISIINRIKLKILFTNNISGYTEENIETKIV